MHIAAQIATQLRAVHVGGNWTAVNLKAVLEGVTWKQATAKVGAFNTIAALVFHCNYYVNAVTSVLQGGPLDAKDQYSFDHPPVRSQEDWDALRDKTEQDAERLASLIENRPESLLGETFVDEKYGSYYRNIHGVIEHCHYHLGQMVLIKKLLQPT